ncbi:hypothetical protein LguiB_029026 [Lonicera macranthoides]
MNFGKFFVLTFEAIYIYIHKYKYKLIFMYSCQSSALIIVKKCTNFDILNWWRVNGVSKYLILALIARDILAIPVSTIASESCFSTSGRIIDSFRSSLSPKMVEALICTQNWLRGSHVALNHEPTAEEMEFCENIEKEMSKNVMLPVKGRR